MRLFRQSIQRFAIRDIASHGPYRSSQFKVLGDSREDVDRAKARWSVVRVQRLQRHLSSLVLLLDSASARRLGSGTNVIDRKHDSCHNEYTISLISLCSSAVLRTWKSWFEGELNMSSNLAVLWNRFTLPVKRLVIGMRHWPDSWQDLKANGVCRLSIVLVLVAIRPPSTCWAYTIYGKVVGITDGDTLTLLSSKQTPCKIRLAGIDAPERSQPFGTRSRQNLSQLVFGKTVLLDCINKESYGRLICKIQKGRADICLQQVRDGMAWHYKQYEKEQTPSDRLLYSEAEEDARRKRLGLWSDPNPIPPWDWRHHPAARRKAEPKNLDGNQPIRGNRRSHIFEWPGCPYYDSISVGNRVQFDSAADAERAGYRPARNCAPQ